jgi:hypothetical protein
VITLCGCLSVGTPRRSPWETTKSVSLHMFNELRFDDRSGRKRSNPAAVIKEDSFGDTCYFD